MPTRSTIAIWLGPLARVLAAATIAFTYFNDFIGRLQIVFSALAAICVAALLLDVYFSRREGDNKRLLAIGATAGGLFYLGKLILFSTSEWVVYLISPASIVFYHVPSLIFVTAMLYPWTVDKGR